MSRAVALVLTVSAVGCTEAATIGPMGTVGSSMPQMVFVPYTPPGTLPDAGTAGQTGSGGATGVAGIGPVGTGGMATAGASGGTGSIPTTMLGLRPVGISRDGLVVAGVDETTGTHAMLWTQTTGTLSLPPVSPIHDQSHVAAVSADGSTIVGATWGTSMGGSRESVLWSSAGVPSRLDSLHGVRVDNFPIAVSTDGKFVVGSSGVGPSEAVRWSTGHVEGLGVLPGDDSSEAVAMSADGSTIVGYSRASAPKSQRAFRWTQETGMIEMKPVTSVYAPVEPRAVSPDGSTVASDASASQIAIRRTFIWKNGSMQLFDVCAESSRPIVFSADGSTLLGACLLPGDLSDVFPFVADKMLRATMLPFYPSPTTAIGLSGTGDRIVAQTRPPPGTMPVIVVWTSGALSALKPMMSPQPPLDLIVAALSEDGSTIVGDAEDTAGIHHGWLLRLR
jgi:uncharacterized membrane protein